MSVETLKQHNKLQSQKMNKMRTENHRLRMKIREMKKRIENLEKKTCKG